MFRRKVIFFLKAALAVLIDSFLNSPTTSLKISSLFEWSKLKKLKFNPKGRLSMLTDSKILKLFRAREHKFKDELNNIDDNIRNEALEILRKEFLQKNEYTKKTILVLRYLPSDPSEIIEEQRNILLTACEQQNFTVIEIFYYELGDNKRRENIINFIKALGEKVALVTNHINPQTSYKKAKNFLKI